MRLLLGFLLGVAGGALLLANVDHRALTRELRQAAPSVEPAPPLLPAGAPPEAPPWSEPPSSADPMPDSGDMTALGDTASDAAVDAVDPAVVAEPSTLGPQPAPAWQPVWKPFTARSAAAGFAAYLSGLTGEALRVRELPDRVYQVEMAARSEEQRRASLRRIEALTGLTLLEEQP